MEVASAHLAAELIGAAALVGLLVAVRRHHRRRREATSILAGVRSVISDDPDAAIEALSDAARLGTPQAFETYLALGALFRRTGDLSRAIRLHRNMLAAGRLEQGQRVEVERELAQDYRRGGMLAEAAELLARHAPGDRASAEALREVLADRGAWRDAAALEERLGGPGSGRLRAHLLAAAARAELAAEPPRTAAAVRAAGEAVAADPGCADALLALAEARGAERGGEGALEPLERALESEPEAALLALPALERLADPGPGLALLQRRLAARPADAALLLLRARLLHRAGQRAEALEVAGAALGADADGSVTLALREILRRAETPAAADPGELAARHALTLEVLRRPVLLPRCQRCGGEAPAREWRCRSCGAFGSLLPSAR